MSNVALSGNASGTGTFTIASPNSNTDRTLNLPDASGTIVSTDASGNLLVGTTTNTNSSRIVSNGVIESTTGGVRFPDGSTQNTAAVNWPGVYNGTVAANTVYPIGTTIVIQSTTATPVNLNTSFSVFLNGSIGFATSGSTALAGTWRSRGIPADVDYVNIVMQRTA